MFLFTFHQRHKELIALEKMLNEDGFSFSCIYGRRRVGKTSLINKFIEISNTKYISYTAMEYDDDFNLNEFSKKVLAVYPSNIKFNNYKEIFEYISEQVKDDKLIIFIDEYPYIASNSKSISSIIQNVIDQSFINKNIKLILCGSSMSFMENQVLGYKSPLYGRKTMQIKVIPFDYYETSLLVDNYSNEEKMLLYAITGGIPFYVNLFKKYNNIDEAIINEFLSVYGVLYDEPINLLKQELRDPKFYNSIIDAIASGDTKLNNISSKVKEENSKVNKYLSNLIGLHIVTKEESIINKSKRNSIYKIQDNMFKFWYKYIPKYKTNIECNDGVVIYNNIIKKELNHFISSIFEDSCKQFLLRENSSFKLPFYFNQIGRWWGNNKELKREEEIDIVAYDDNNILFAECKYSDSKIDLNILNKLINKSTLIITNKKPVYYLFSKVGFTDELINYKNDNVVLITLDDMYK